MARNIKLFNNHSAYEAYIAGQNKILPNVSYCLDVRDVHYNEIENATITAQFRLDGIRGIGNVQIYAYEPNYGVNGAAMFSKITVDGQEVPIAEIDSSSGFCPMEEDTLYTVVYTVKNPTMLGVYFQERTPVEIGACFAGCSNLVSIELPDTITSVHAGALDECGGITALTLPSSVTYIASFYGMSSLSTLTVLAATPPTLEEDGLGDFNPTMIFVPGESVEAYCNADVWSVYESIIRPILAGGGGDDPIEK